MGPSIIVGNMMQSRTLCSAASAIAAFSMTVFVAEVYFLAAHCSSASDQWSTSFFNATGGIGFVLEVDEQMTMFLTPARIAEFMMFKQPFTVGFMISPYPRSSSSSRAGVPSGAA